MTDQEMLMIDAQDVRSKRGGKLERDRNSAKSQAKIWIIFLFVSIIFFVSLRVSDETVSTECEAQGSCNCLDVFDAGYTAYVLLLLFFTGFKVKVGFKSNKTYMTRRELKVFRRQTGCIFGFLFQIPSSIMIYGFIKDTIREACKEDVRFQRMD